MARTRCVIDMSKNLSEWIIGSNPVGDRWFVMHAADPWFVAETQDATQEIDEAILDSFSYSGGGYTLFNFRWLGTAPAEREQRWLLARAVMAVRSYDNRPSVFNKIAAACTVSAKIRAARGEARMSQTDLARASGTSTTQVCQIENGKRTPTREVIERFAQALGIDVGQLL